MQTLFKKTIAHLTIVSIFMPNVAVCMHADEEAAERGFVRAPFSAPVPINARNQGEWSWTDDAGKASPPGASYIPLKERGKGFLPSARELAEPLLEDRDGDGVEDADSLPHSSSEGEDTLPQDSRLRAFLQQMGWTEADLTAPLNLATLQKLAQVEMSFWPPRWVSMDHLLEKLFYAPLLNRDGIAYTDQGKPTKACCSRFWIRGKAIPLKSKSIRRQAVGINALREGVEDGILDTLHLTLTFLLGYQLTSSTRVNLFDTFNQADHNSILGIANLMHRQPAVFAVLATPLAFGLGKALWNAFQMDESTMQAVNRKKESIDAYGQGLWQDWLRPLLPLPPMDRYLARLQRLILWDGQLSGEARAKAFEAIVVLAKDRHGYSQLSAMYSLGRIAHGLHLKDTSKLKEIYDKQTLLQLLSLKTRALETLQTLRKDLHQRQGCNYTLINALYADSLLWSLGQSPSKTTSVLMSTFKAGKVTVQALFLKMIIETIIEYINCPDKPGFTWTGYQPWASDYSENCFDELVRQFNIIPGQPASSLVDNLSEYYFPGGTYSLDLSNKGIEGDVIVEIIQGFVKNDITLTSLNLASNSVNKARFFEAMLPSLSSLTQLNLSNNGIEDPKVKSISADTMALAQGFKSLPFLTALDLSHNEIGSTDSQGTVAIGNGLRNLITLTYLDLSGNEIGRRGSQGAVAIGNGLQYLTRLTLFDFSGNEIGGYDSQGVVAIGNGLPYLNRLTSLDLSRNEIGWTSSQGTVAIGNALPYLNRLTFLDLSRNDIGWIDSNGTVAIGNGLPYLVRLTSLDLSINSIGHRDSQGVMSLVHALSCLKELHVFNIQPQSPALNSTYIALLNQALASTDVRSPIPLTLSTEEDVNNYFARVPHNTASFNFSALIGNPQIIVPLMKILVTYPSLTSLDLSYNYIGYTDPQGIVFIGNGLRNLTSLTTLDLSNNYIGNRDSQGPAAIGNSLQYLTRLTSLDLSSNGVGYIDSKGTVAIGNALRNLASLTFLNLSNNYIGNTDSQGTAVIGNGVRHLTSLTSLDLSFNGIGNTDSQGTVAIGNGLQYTTSLTFLDVSNNGIGYTDSQGTVAIGNGLQYTASLTFLDVSNNDIGYTDSQGTVALGNGLQYLPFLKILQLSGNNIGSTDKVGPEAILKALPKLPNLQTIGLSGMQNISWSDGAQVLASLRGEALRAACEAELCFSTPLHPVNPTQPQPLTLPAPVHTDSLAQEGLSLLSHTSSAVPRAQPMGHDLWRALSSAVASIKPWLSFDAWLDSAKKSAFNLAVERDPYTGQFVNAMPATFPNLLIPNHDRWTPQIPEDQLFLNASVLAGPPSLLPGSQPLSVTP